MPGIIDAPRGFIPIASPTGELGRVRGYDLAAANTALGKHDMVTLTAAGTIDRSAASDTQIVGIVPRHAAASAATVNFPVMDDYTAILLCQFSDGTPVNADRFLNYNIVVAAAVNNMSQMEADGTTGATTNTLPVKFLRVHTQPGNTIGANAAIEVSFNNSVLKSIGVVGV